jgi:hypothetical protein
VAEQLPVASQQLRLSALYDSARRALQLGQWDRALSQLDSIAETAPQYRDIYVLRAMAQRKEPLVDDAGADLGAYQTQVDGPGTVQAERVVGVGGGTVRYGTRPPAMERSLLRRPLVLALLVLILALTMASVFLFRGQPGISSSTDMSTPSSTVQSATVVLTLPGSSTGTVRAAPAQVTVALMAGTQKPDTESTATPTALSGAPADVQPEPGSTVTPTLTGPAHLPPTVTHPAAPAATPRLPGQLAIPRYDPERQTYDLHVCRLDGSDCRHVASEASQPDFLPDGSQLVVHSWKPDDKGLVLQTLSGQRIWKISNRIESARPAVDSQGKIYVFHSREESDRRPRLYRTYGPETRPIMREGGVVLGQAPSWLPDGRILYSGCFREGCGILVMNNDGTFPQQIAAGSNETNPESSPDGQHVAFMSQRDGNWEIYVVGLDGSGLQRLTRNPANDGLPTWSPDGSHIAFVSDRDGPWAVWVMRPDGSDQRSLFGIGGPLDGQPTGAALHEIHGWVEERLSWGTVP